MTRRALAIYVALVGAYELLMGASYALSNGPPVMFDPRLPINWIFPRVFDRVPAPLAVVLVLSFLWHSIAAVGLFRSGGMVPVFAVGETILSIPGLLLYGSALFGYTSHGFAGGVVAVGFAVFAVCDLAPVVAAYHLMFRSNLSARASTSTN